MAKTAFDPNKVLGKKITEMSRQELCEFVSKLCALIESQNGSNKCRGGIFPENISLDDEGCIGIGPARLTDWDGQELNFIAPEIYWHGKPSAAADVYSVGLLLYYAVSGGRLPLEDECRDAQLRRMGGDNYPAPKGAGRRLGEIIEKAIRFKPADRYQTLGELKADIDSCIKNLYLSGAPSAEAIFNKNDDDLSEIERMMVGIIEKSDEEEEKAGTDEAGEEGVKVYAPVKNPEAEMIARKIGSQSGPSVSKFREDKDAELQPIVPQRNQVKTPPVQYTHNLDREKKIAEDVKKRRRRPLAVILVMCALLIVVAIVFNAMLKDYQQSRLPDNSFEVDDPYSGTMAPVETEAPSDVDIAGEEEEPALPTPPPMEHGYQFIKEDVSWTTARARCQELGGHLVTINDEEEFNAIVALAEENGVSRVWIGCHRIDGVLVWESEGEGYFNWAKGEPSYVDVNDEVAEDYVMLWNNNGWVYNDNRNDPIADYPQWYSGTVGYVCEFGD